MITDPARVQQLQDAYHQIRNLEAAAIERGALWLEIQGKGYHTFKNADGFSVSADLNALLDADVEFVTFYHRDEQGRGSTQSVRIPRAFLFGEATEEEKEFLEYKRLDKKFGPRK